MKKLTIVIPSVLFLLLCSSCSPSEAEIPSLPIAEENQDLQEDLPDEETIEEPSFPGYTEEEEGNKAPSGHWETILTSDPAWDEYVLISAAWDEKVLVKAAWDEEKTYCSAYGQDSYEGYECSCGKVSGTLEEVMAHVRETDNCNAWHGKTIYYGESHCLAYAAETIHHDAEYQTIHHDAVYDVIHHNAVAYEKQIWVED